MHALHRFKSAAPSQRAKTRCPLSGARLIEQRNSSCEDSMTNTNALAHRSRRRHRPCPRCSTSRQFVEAKSLCTLTGEGGGWEDTPVMMWQRCQYGKAPAMIVEHAKILPVFHKTLRLQLKACFTSANKWSYTSASAVFSDCRTFSLQ